MKTFRDDLAAAGVAAMSCAWLAVLAVLLLLAACGGPEKAAGPSAADAAVIGSWAGQVDAQGVPLLLTMALQEDKAYKVEILQAGDLVEREKGSWRLQAGRVYFTPATCDQAEAAGGPLRPVTCEPGDDMPVNISGDTWTIHFPAGGELVTFELKKI
jgi:ABC-type glycerol-3-phosphate transport system substrate-binding protein